LTNIGTGERSHQRDACIAALKAQLADSRRLLEALGGRGHVFVPLGSVKLTSEAQAEWDLGMRQLEERARPVSPAAVAPVCSTCNDTHWMTLGDRVGNVMCARCPVPCDACRGKLPGGGLGPYCATTPCPCECHVKRAK